MIKRYYLDSGMDKCESCAFTEDQDGEWVRWEDVQDFNAGTSLWITVVLDHLSQANYGSADHAANYALDRIERFFPSGESDE